MPVDLCASWPHFLSHLLPVWRALPAGERGAVYLDSPLNELVPGSRPLRDMVAAVNPVIVAGLDDLRRVNGQPAILFEHGCGQSYLGDAKASHNPSYAGGDGRHGVSAFLVPNEYAAAPNRRANPDAIVEIVGSPRLAALQGIPAAPEGGRPTVAFAFHWHCGLNTETRSTFGYWIDAAAKLAKDGRVEVLGHAHPRMFAQIAPLYAEHGIEPVSTFEEILARADVLAVDNSSVLFEFAALRGPVVVLDHPDYRQDVHHGLRFWDCADVGPRILDPLALPIAVEQALNTRPWPGAEQIIDRVFPPVAEPAQVAADAVLRALGHPPARLRSGSRFPRVALSR